jgi:hypothetical protein
MTHFPLTTEPAVRVVDRRPRHTHDTVIPADVITAAQQSLHTPEIRLQDVTVRRPDAGPDETVYTFVLRNSEHPVARP